MDRYRSYHGRSGASRRRHSTVSSGSRGDKASRRAAKLIVCIVLFAIAAFMKFAFPSALQAVGDKLNSVVNYRAALASLGEGFSGEKKFTAALGEAFTYAFTGAPPTAPAAPSTIQGAAAGTDKTAPANVSPAGNAANASGGSQTGGAKASAIPAGDQAVQTFSQEKAVTPTPNSGSGGQSASGAAASASPGAAQSGLTNGEKSFSDAVIAAFLQSQEQYSDYAIPAGVSYGAPKIGFEYAAPLHGVVSSTFGFRVHPTDKKVKFHYGTDIAVKTGTPIAAFADGKVIAAGTSESLGNFIILSHAGVESEYAHCDKLYVKSGQTVKKGDKIGTTGRTGNATEQCLHFELRVNGVYVNPEFYVQWT